MSEVDLNECIRLAKEASYVEARYEDIVTEYIVYMNGRIKEIGSNRLVGLGVKAWIGNHLGFSSTDDLTVKGISEVVDSAISNAKASKEEVRLSTDVICEGTYVTHGIKVHPQDVGWEEKIKLISDLYKHATDLKAALREREFCPRDVNIKSITIRYVAIYGTKRIADSENREAVIYPIVTGLSIFVVSSRNGTLGDGYVSVGGSIDYKTLVNEVYNKIYEATWKAAEKTIAVSPEPYEGPVVIRPSVAGLFAHESFGHMSEGDFIAIGSSPLGKLLGSKIASDAVTIIDTGETNYKYGIYLPVDDEGIRTKPVYLVEKGIVRGFLHNRESASELRTQSTGNGRAQNHRYIPLVRMRNTFFEQGDWSEDEMIRECRRGVIVDDGRGGQAELDGTFTFSASRGYVIEDGEVKRPIRDIILTGNILTMLKYVRGAARNVEIDSSPFGACGKGGQSVYVGAGGPSLYVEVLRVGGQVG